MTRDGQSTATPKLRFPGFRGTGGWRSRILGEEGEFLPSLTGKSAQHFGVGNAKYITYMNVFSNTFADMTSLGTVDVGEGESQTAVASGDILFTVSSETPEEVGMSSVVLQGVPVCYLNSFCTLFRFARERRPDLHFLGYLMRQPIVRKYLAERAQGSTRFNLSKAAFRSLPFAVPSTAEQQKIADCLMSLDKMIAAQGRKVEALEAHKRGLMQQLFPREGETLPPVRFPEFRKGPGWVLRSIGDMLEEVARPIEMDDDEEYSLITVRRRYGGVVSRECLKGRAIKVKSQFVVRTKDFLISKRQIVHDACGLVPPDLDGSIVSNEYSVLGPRNGCDIEFFSYFSQQPVVSASFLQSSVGIVIEKMLFKLKSWLKLEFPFPSIEEQREIAGCLKSVDALIAADSEKLDALMTHKKGLMQQVFPSPEGD